MLCIPIGDLPSCGGRTQSHPGSTRPRAADLGKASTRKARPETQTSLGYRMVDTPKKMKMDEGKPNRRTSSAMPSFLVGLLIKGEP